MALLLFKLTNSNYLNENLALIQWYDFKYTNDPKRFYKYECPYLKLIKNYNIIDINAIVSNVHIIPHHNHQNAFL